MRLYVLVTGAIFALILVAHALRVRAEGTWLLREPSFLLTSLLAGAMAGWAVVLCLRPKK
jgi:hypothetical protein